MKRLLPLLLCVACHTTTTAPPSSGPATPGDLRVQVVRLEHARADAVATALASTLATRPTGGSACRVVAQPDQNAVVLSGTTEQIREALDLVARLDTQPAR